MGRPRKKRKDLPPGLYWSERRGFYYYRVLRGETTYAGIGKVNREKAIKAWVKITNRAELETTAGTFGELIDLFLRVELPRCSSAPSVAFARARQFFSDMLSQIGTVPGVVAAGATMAPPGYVDSTGGYLIDQLPAKADWTRAPSVVLSIVTPGTFAALGIPLKSGRDFSNGDTLDRPFVAVVNEALVRKSFPNQNPLGRTIFCPFDTLKGMTIIGVAGDVRQRGPSMNRCRSAI